MADDVLLLSTTYVFVSFLISFEPVHCQKNTLDGLIDVLGNVAELIGDKTPCVFKCPKGQEVGKDPAHTPSYDGCGSYGFQIDTHQMPWMTDCCNKHDMCYDTCLTKRNECDREFRHCLTSNCDVVAHHEDIFNSKQHHEGCITTANLMYTGTTALGCKAFISSQKKACICLSKRYNRSRNEL